VAGGGDRFSLLVTGASHASHVVLHRRTGRSFVLTFMVVPLVSRAPVVVHRNGGLRCSSNRND